MQPQYTGYPSYQPAQKKKPKWPWVLLGVGALLVMAVCFGVMVLANSAGNSLDNQIEHGNTELRNHVKIDACKTDAAGFAEITYTVSNVSNDVQDYWIQFSINDPNGNRLHEAHGIVNKLAAGKTAAKQKTIGGQVTGKFTCGVERVN